MQLALLAMVAAVGHPASLDAKSVYDRVQSGVVPVNTSAKVGSGFVIRDGTVIVTRHPVVPEPAAMSTDDRGFGIASLRAKERPFQTSTPQVSVDARLQSEIQEVLKGERAPGDLVKYGSAAIPPLLEALKTPDDGDYNPYLIAALLEFGDPLQAPLLNVMANGTEFQRRGAVAVVRRIAEFTSPPNVLSAPPRSVRAWIDDRRDKQFKFARSEDVKRGLLKAFRIHDVEYGSGQAGRALAYLGYGREIKEELMKATASEDSAIALSAFEALIVSLDKSEKADARMAFDQIFEGTTEDDLDEDENNKRIEIAADVLEKTRTAVGAELVLELLKHEDWEVRFEMCDLLAERREMAALPLVKELLDAEEESVRWAALAAVGNLARGEMTDKMAAYAKSSSSDDRQWGIYDAGLTRTEAGLEIVLSCIDDSESDVRSMVAGALENIGGERAKTALKKLAKDPDADVRQAAKDALEALKEREAEDNASL